MNYAPHYDRLVARARGRVLTGYCERHHVLPRCMGGGNEPQNIVELTPEEHYVAHQLLVKMYPESSQLAHAAVWMSKRCSGMRGKKHTPEHRAKISEKLRGRPSTMTGRKHTYESRLKMSAAQSGKIFSPETRARISAALSGRKFSPEHCAKLSEAQRGNKKCLGRHSSPETRAKLRASWVLRKQLQIGVAK